MFGPFGDKDHFATWDCVRFAKRHGSRFLDFWVSWVLGLLVSGFLGFSVSWFLGFLVSGPLGFWVSWFLAFLLAEFLVFV